MAQSDREAVCCLCRKTKPESEFYRLGGNEYNRLWVECRKNSLTKTDNII